MAIDDPRKRVAAQDEDTDDLREQLNALQSQMQALLTAKASSGGISPDMLETMLAKVSQVSADAAERAANPSNKFHPEISAYSYPEGDRARPRAFKCPMFWVGYDLGLDTTSAEEIELLNQAQPGIFDFTRTDGRRDQLTVTGEMKPDGSYERLLFTFQVKEGRETLPPMASMLRQAFKVKTAEQIELDRLRAEVEAMRAKQTVSV